MNPLSEIFTHDDTVSEEIVNKNHTNEHAPTGAASLYYCAANVEWSAAFYELFVSCMGDDKRDA